MLIIIKTNYIRLWRGVAILLKGVNKRVIIIKNPESEIFEEACFVLKSSGGKGIFKQSKDNEMLIEANRIISDYHNQQRSIIEKNGVTSNIGGDMSELDNFLNINNNTGYAAGNDVAIDDNSDKTKDDKYIGLKKNNDGQASINHSMSHMSDEDIFEDDKFFENMQGNAGKYNGFYKNSDYTGYKNESKKYKPAFSFISSKRLRFGIIPVPPKSFFIGVGFMSAVIIIIRLIEYIVLR